MFSIKCRNQNQSNPSDQSEQGRTLSLANENSKCKHANCLKRGKTRMTKSRLFLVMHLIGGEDGARFLNQSQIKVK